MHSQERLHHLLRFTPTTPGGGGGGATSVVNEHSHSHQHQSAGEYAEAIRAERFYYQSLASQYMTDF